MGYEFQWLKKARFFNIVKNKNAPFFEVFTSVNLKKVRFFVIFEEKVLQDEYCHMPMIFSWTTFLTNIEKKTHLFQIYTSKHLKKRCVFIFHDIEKTHLFIFSYILFYACTCVTVSYDNCSLREYTHIWLISLTS